MLVLDSCQLPLRARLKKSDVWVRVVFRIVKALSSGPTSTVMVSSVVEECGDMVWVEDMRKTKICKKS